MKKLLAVLLSILVLGTQFALVASAEETAPFHFYTETTVAFQSMTTGANVVFDNNEDTAFDGSITGMFNQRTVITGLKVLTKDEISNLVIKGSEDGINWVTLFTESIVNEMFPAELGSSGPGKPSSGSIRDQMYTYAWKFLRFETDSGKIGEIKMYGYTADITGTILDLDTSYGTNGWSETLSNYTPPKADYVFDRLIGADWNKGEVIKSISGDTTKTASLTVKLEKSTKITEIAFSARPGESDVIYNRFNHIYFEASANGIDWTTLATTSDNFAVDNGFGKTYYRISVLTVDDTNAYSYVRVRSDVNSVTPGWLTLGELDVYGTMEQTAADVNAVLNNWTDDPHQVAGTTSTEKTTTEAPATTKAPKNTTAPTTEATDANEQENGGCFAASSASAAFLAICILGIATVFRKKKFTAQ